MWRCRWKCVLLPSRIGLASRTCCSIQECWPLMAARNWRISLVLSVFPAPDSPLNTKTPADTNTSSFTNFYTRISKKIDRDQLLPDNAALVTVIPLHIEVAVVSYGKDVRGHFTDLLVGVLADLVSCVDRQQLVWIYCNQYGACICLWRSIDRSHDED